MTNYIYIPCIENKKLTHSTCLPAHSAQAQHVKPPATHSETFTLQHAATCCNMLQHAAAQSACHWSTSALSAGASYSAVYIASYIHIYSLIYTSHIYISYIHRLQRRIEHNIYSTTCCKMLQHATTCCNMLQHNLHVTGLPAH